MLKNIKHPITILAVLSAFAGTYGIGYLSSLVTDTLLTNSYFTIGIFLALSMMLYHTFEDIGRLGDRHTQKQRILFAFLTAAVFALTLVLGYQLKAFGMTDSSFKGKGLILLRSLLLSFSILPFSNLLYKWAEKIRTFEMNKVPKTWNTKKLFFLV